MSVRLLMAIHDIEKVFSSCKDKSTLLILAGLSDDYGACFCLVSTIAKRCVLSTRSIRRALTSLEESGFLRRVHRKAKDSRSNISSEFFINIKKIYLSTSATNKDKLFPEFKKQSSSLEIKGANAITNEPDQVAREEGCVSGGTDRLAGITSTLINTNNINIISSETSNYSSSASLSERPKKKSRAKNNPVNLDYSCFPSMPSQPLFNEWLALRKKKGRIVSQTVINMLGKELYQCIEAEYSVDMAFEVAIYRGWIGIKAEWVINYFSKENSCSHQQYNKPKGDSFEMNDTSWADGLHDAINDKLKARNYGQRY